MTSDILSIRESNTFERFLYLRGVNISRSTTDEQLISLLEKELRKILEEEKQKQQALEAEHV